MERYEEDMRGRFLGDFRPVACPRRDKRSMDHKIEYGNEIKYSVWKLMKKVKIVEGLKMSMVY